MDDSKSDTTISEFERILQNAADSAYDNTGSIGVTFVIDGVMVSGMTASHDEYWNWMTGVTEGFGDPSAIDKWRSEADSSQVKTLFLKDYTILAGSGVHEIIHGSYLVCDVSRISAFQYGVVRGTVS